MANRTLQATVIFKDIPKNIRDEWTNVIILEGITELKW